MTNNCPIDLDETPILCSDETCDQCKPHRWDAYLQDPNIKIIMDNDGWWFAYKTNGDSEEEWFDGGDGPYGIDLLEHILKRAGIPMEWV